MPSSPEGRRAESSVGSARVFALRAVKGRPKSSACGSAFPAFGLRPVP
jgi:hypothetical protein